MMSFSLQGFLSSTTLNSQHILVTLSFTNLQVHLETATPLHDVRVMVDVARPLVALNGDVTLTSLLDHHQMAFTVKQAGTSLPSSLDLKVVALYQNASGMSSHAFSQSTQFSLLSVSLQLPW